MHVIQLRGIENAIAKASAPTTKKAPAKKAPAKKAKKQNKI